MFRKLHDPGSSVVTIHVDGIAVPAEPGESVAAVLLRQGSQPYRRTLIGGAPRSPFCMMGVCFECLVDIDGQGSVQGCQTPVQDGMTVTRPQGRRGLPE